MKFTLRLQDNTVGTVERQSVNVGDVMDVFLSDPNGNRATKTGIVAEILTEDMV